MAFNLLRNTRAFFTTNVNANTGVVNNGGFTATNTFEIQVLDGLSFSQNTTAETVTINEAGSAPVRGQRAFNTALDPVEFSFSTYIKPRLVSGEVICEEQYLWNALAAGRTPTPADAAIDGTEAAWTAGATSVLSFENSQAHQLQAFGMLFFMDGTCFVIDNCALDQATIDFGLDALATTAWTGRGTKLRQIQGGAISNTGTISGTGLTGTANSPVTLKDTAANYIANKLSTMKLHAGINSTASAFNIPITGGSITFANNITYLTPANLGVVNQPVTYFTGTRAISGNVTAYLRTGGTNDTSDLIDQLISSSTTDVSPAYNMVFSIGGESNNTKVVLALPAAMLQIPTISTEQVVSTTINFTAHGWVDATPDAYDLGAANEATLTYHSA
jgi:hypothetical protein